MFKQFLSIFLSKFPDRFACMVIIIGIVCLGSFAYQTVGLPIQIASAESLHSADGANQSAINWAYGQKYFGDRIKPETIVSDVRDAGGDAYDVRLAFASLEYKVDPGTGSLHHVPVNHTVDIVVSQGRVLSAYENSRDLVNDSVHGPISDVTADCL